MVTETFWYYGANKYENSPNRGLELSVKFQIESRKDMYLSNLN